jgi:hypothetical protein
MRASKRTKAGSLYSPRSQQSYIRQWQLERELTNCKSEIGLWKRKLQAAEEGKNRQASQIAAGKGYAHSILEEYVREATEAKEMILAFEQRATDLQGQIDALTPDIAKAAERRQAQESVARLLALRLEGDKKLDLVLETARQLLSERETLTATVRELVRSLDFRFSVALDDERYGALLRMLPKGMAAVSGGWVTWFLGQEDGRCPSTIEGGEFLLPETLKSAIAFRPGDCPALTLEERRMIKAQSDSRIVPTPAACEAAARLPGAEVKELPVGTVQWGLLRP